MEYFKADLYSVFACHVMKSGQIQNVCHHDFQETWKQNFAVSLLTDSSTDSAIKILTFVVGGSSNNFSVPHLWHRGILQMPHRRLNNSASEYQDITGLVITWKKNMHFTALKCTVCMHVFHFYRYIWRFTFKCFSLAITF